MKILPEKIKLRFKLTALLVVLAFMPLTLVTGLTILRMRNLQTENAVSAQQRIADSAVQEFSDFIGSQFSSLDEASRLYSTAGVDLQTADRLLDRILFANKNLVSLAVIDKSGQEIAHKHRFRLIQPDQLGIRSNETSFLIVNQRENYVGPIYFENGKPQFIIAESITDATRQFKGAVIAEIDARVMQEVVDSISSVRGLGRAYVVDRNGIVAAHPDISNVLGKRNFSFLPAVSFIRGNENGFSFQAPYENELGEKVLGAFSPVQVDIKGVVPRRIETSWFIIAEVPASVALSAVNTITFFALGVLLLVLILAAASGVVFAKRIVSPIEILHKAMSRFGRGELRARAEVKTGDEIEDLAGGFNRMADELGKAVFKLEEDKNIISAERNKLAVVLSGIQDAVIALDDGFKIAAFNLAAERLTGVKEKDALNKKAKDIFKIYKAQKEVAPENYCPKITDGFEGISFSDKNLRLIGFQNKESFVEGSAGHISEAGQVGIRCMLVLHDITKEQVVEKIKREFVSLVAHQLRTPLSGLRWLVGLFLKGDMGKMNEKQKKFLKQGDENMAFMMRMIDELLDVARMEEGRYHYKPEKTDILPFLNSVISGHKKETDEKKLGITFEKIQNLPSVYIDPITFRIAFQNVFENAVLYTKPGGEIKVSAERKGGEVVVAVKDTGIGITEEEKKQVFSKFFRGKQATSMATEGSGIGLYMVKNILESQGGRIWFESEGGKGTSVFMALPVG